MTHTKLNVLLVTTALSLTLIMPSQVLAQTTAQATAPEKEIVVTGTRTPKRSRLDTLAPVDVIRAENLQAQASTELAEGLSKLAPSITFPRPSVTDGTDSVRPATLRGLAPDQALVLVNGKRRHHSALVSVNGSVGRGSSAVDLNTIPEAALDRLEVLRDGASAQYGSDAIAGVVNLILRKANHGGSLSAGYSQYMTKVEGPFTSRNENDGATKTLGGWIGLPLFTDGSLTISGEYKEREPTSRGDLDKRAGAPTPFVVTSRYGDPSEKALTLFVNSELPLGNDWTAYSWASYQDRENESAANFRQSTNSGNVIALYPNGFLPMIGVDTTDASLAIGIKGQWGAWSNDFSLTSGTNEIVYHTNNSVNASLGSASKKNFYSGKMIYGQTVFNANIARGFDVAGLYSPLNLALGLEAREETYKIGAGELQSYQNGNAPGGTLGAGAQGFPGFAPSNATNVKRNNIGVYVDLETNFTEKLSTSFAARAEKYSDFGSNLSGKLGARYDFTPAFAIRGALSTGFRAPSLQQQYFTSTATNFITVPLVPGPGNQTLPFDITTFPVSTAPAIALGATQLKPEKSTNYALGFVYHKGPFELTLDGYQIRITDRIVLSENLLITNSGVATLLAPFGVGGGRFFINGVDTTTKGVDLVARYRIPTESLGIFDLSLAANNTNTIITRFPKVNTLSSLPSPPALFAHVNEYLLGNSTPENKATLSLDWKKGGWSASASAVYYGDIVIAQNNAALDYSNGDHTLINVSAKYSFASKTTISFGADNLFDEYPAQLPTSLVTSTFNGGAVYSARSPFGFNGRNVYLRISQGF